MPRAWTLLLVAYLLVWVPVSFAGEFFATLPSIGRRGVLAVTELAAHAGAAAICATAAWMLLVRSPSAGTGAAIAVIVSGLVTIQSLFWTVLPRQIAPGQALPLAALASVHMAFWLALLRFYARRGRHEAAATKHG